MATPAKKTSSFADQVSSKKDDNVEDTSTSQEDTFSQNNEKDAAAEEDKAPNDLDQPATAKAVKQEEGKDNQLKNDENLDQFVNPDGVTFSGKVNPINKTPDQISHETPAESAARYGLKTGVPDHISDNPNVSAHKDFGTFQIPGGTHLHPDIARDNYNRSVGSSTENGTVTRTVSELVFAEPAKVDDKGIGNFVIDPVNDSHPHENVGTVNDENPNAVK